jgi:hypothetical protein
MLDATKTLLVAVIVIVSPSTSASDTPMLNTINVGAVPTARLLTVVAAPHVRRPDVEYPVWPVSATVDVEDTALNVTVDTESPKTLRFPVQTIAADCPEVTAVCGCVVIALPERLVCCDAPAAAPLILHVQPVGAADQIAELAVIVIVSAAVPAVVSATAIVGAIPVVV